MSYARFSEGDVYVFGDAESAFTCCGCKLAPKTDSLFWGYGNFCCKTNEEMRTHLELHALKGHSVPSRAFQRLDDEAGRPYKEWYDIVEEVVVSEESLKKISDIIANPPEPNENLTRLMSDNPKRDMSSVTLFVAITNTQYEALRKIAEAKKCSMADVGHEAIASFLSLREWLPPRKPFIPPEMHEE